MSVSALSHASALAPPFPAGASGGFSPVAMPADGGGQVAAGPSAAEVEGRQQPPSPAEPGNAPHGGREPTTEQAEYAREQDPLQDPASPESQMIAELSARDAEVRAHEQAHVATGGQYVTSGPTYSYQSGPDGRRYAIGGEVGIDVAEVPGDPAATIAKMMVVQRAALAPAEPSGQDLRVAAQAAQTAMKARAELALSGPGGAGAPGTAGTASAPAEQHPENGRDDPRIQAWREADNPAPGDQFSATA